ncbi:LysE family translocator [Vibrio sonorensis]|uniref:LysE family translocator n=1 Tax=Vibrio sonorensis TaxID=1004316 RepID=UPI0008D98AA5|nr:LysE family translocator [Vibrio sonorensis]
MSIDTWMLFCLAYLVTTLSPGPNVLLVLKNSVQYGWTSATIAILGNLMCQMIIVVLVAVGVGELLQQLPFWFVVLKVLGGLYLIYLGIKNLLALRHSTPTHLPTSSEERSTKTRSQMFWEAFFVSASNPKTVIFLSAFLPQFLDTEKAYNLQFAIMFASISVIVAVVHLCYAKTIALVGNKLIENNFEQRLAKLTGGLFITMGGSVLLSSRA